MIGLSAWPAFQPYPVSIRDGVPRCYQCNQMTESSELDKGFGSHWRVLVDITIWWPLQQNLSCDLLYNIVQLGDSFSFVPDM